MLNTTSRVGAVPRFGENDPTMSLEERTLEGFPCKRQIASNAIVFSLEDDQKLTHCGQSVSKFDDVDRVGILDDENEDSTGRNYRILPKCIDHLSQAKSMPQRRRRFISEGLVTKLRATMMTYGI